MKKRKTKRRTRQVRKAKKFAFQVEEMRNEIFYRNSLINSKSLIY